MRVIAGSAKGRKLQTIEGLNTRPTTDRIKETLFNIMAFDMPRKQFLDLFSGSGAIGIEALSRGAEQAVFVEQSAECVNIIKSNLEHTLLAENGRVLQMSVLDGLDKLASEGATFDIIFMDPPYAAGLSEATLEAIVAKGLLEKDGYIVLERSAEIPLPEVDGLSVLREKKYKTTVLSFLGFADLEEEES
ncbi:16S rRNA (guanine(966)-N(2))-methyltransferase RsmD [Chakrabartyella piscis]|uniref:16S rRNA (guanine(966)-N(2))-methyltransferase RsmD n=1 Tax=Chakrabartyella piscis TaxID=2918914 RepID=UPI002958718A|nr:16S rRNA (guanine(966)-N(2))-methyltransferase RsmD [Chakrabartyella piscis]